MKIGNTETYKSAKVSKILTYFIRLSGIRISMKIDEGFVTGPAHIHPNESKGSEDDTP